MINRFALLVVSNGFRRTLISSHLLKRFRSMKDRSSSPVPTTGIITAVPKEILPHYANNQLFTTPIHFGLSSSLPNGANVIHSYSYCSVATTETGSDGRKPGEVSAVSENSRDPTKIVSVETSIRYLKSDAYTETYGETRVWVLYRRNFKGAFAPKKTRKNCFLGGKLTTGNPCPICRDEYLVLDYRNTDLLKQFISPFNGEIIGTEKTGLCRHKHFLLLAAIDKAKDYGTITFDVKFREYDYEEYYSKDVLHKLHSHHHHH